MSVGLFNQVGLVPIAYIRVESSGVAPNANSGLSVTKLSTGVYRIDIPVEVAVPVKELFPHVQIWYTQAFSQIQQVGSDVPATQLLVLIYDPNGNYVDSTFTLTLHRTVSPPVDGEPA